MSAPKVATHARLKLALRPTTCALLVTSLATVLSYTLPREYSATGVGAAFWLATYWLVLRRDSATIAHFGLALGGVLQPVPLRLKTIAESAGKAMTHAGLLGAITLVPFALLYARVWPVPHGFQAAAPPSLDEVLGQWLVIAVPEEIFYRGYLQTAYDDALRYRVRIAGASIGPGVLLASVVFALGHLATRPDPERLAVFFPSLAFGWLRARTGGVGASALYHAACNLAATYLGHSYFGP